VALPDDLSGLHQLRVLEMVAPKMRKNLSELFHLPRLQILKLTDTPLSPLQLGLSFSFAPLRFLTLKNAGLKELPLEFAELKTLEELNLSHNQLQQLPMNFFELTRLKRINLDSNRFQLFPQILAQTPSLKHVSLDHNQFSETERERIQRQFHLTVI
jgi:Leucine-rich repeat (LRR) protein